MNLRLRERAVPFVRPVLATVLIALASVGLYLVLVDQEGRLIYQVVSAESGRLRSEMSERLAARGQAIRDLAWRWEGKKPSSSKEWAEDARSLLRPEFMFRAVQWIEPDLHMRWHVPAGARLPHAALDSTHDELRHGELDAALGGNASLFTRSFPLPDAPRLILVCAPMREGERLTGYQVGVLRANDVLDALLKETIQRGFSVQVSEGSFHIFGPVWLEGGKEAEWGSESELRIGDLAFNVTVWPSPEYLREIRSWGPTLALVVGLLLAVLSGVAVYRMDLWKRRALSAAGGGAPPSEEVPPLPEGAPDVEDASEERWTPGPA